MDVHDPATRSYNMSRIKDRDTKIEVQVRSWLHSRGFRFRKNDRRYPGTPDIVLPKYNTIIFINGCFWHRHEGCKYATIPKTRTEFWLDKFEKNIKNDEEHYRELKELGWNVITIWECQLRKDDFYKTMASVEEELRANEK